MKVARASAALLLIGCFAAPGGTARAQSLPRAVGEALERSGYPEVARELARRLEPRAHPDREDVGKLLSRWEERAGGPASGLEWLTVARLWVRAGAPEEARAALRRAKGHIPEGEWRFERARISYLAGGSGADDYWGACRVATESSAQEEWLDLVPLATPEERDGWEELRTLGEGRRDLCAFVRRFWNRRAAASGASVDERIAEHYRRLRFALEHYRRRGKVRTGLGARLGGPPSAVFDDRGLLYLRMGEPDETAAFSGSLCLWPNVTWAYERPGGYRLYHLSPLRGTDDWWLVDDLAAVYRCGRWDRSPFTATPPLLMDIPGGILQELYTSRMGLSPAYARIGFHLATKSGAERLRILEELHEERARTWEDGAYAVRGVPERPEVDLKVRLALEWLQFRSNRPGLTRVWLDGLVEADRLERTELAGGRVGYAFEAVWTLVDDSGDEYRRIRKRAEVELDTRPPEKTGLSVRLLAELPPGPYEYLFTVRDATEPKRRPPGGYLRGTLAVRDVSGETPQVSDLAVAADSGGTWTAGGGVFLRPAPAHTTGSDGIAYVYYEVYNLTPGAAYETRVRLEPEDDALPFVLEYAGTVPDDGGGVVRGVLRLDLADTAPGSYRMSVTVRDLHTGVSTLPVRTGIAVRSAASS